MQSISTGWFCFMRECHVWTFRILVGQSLIKVVALLSSTTRRVARVFRPQNDRLSVGLLDVGGGAVIDASIRWTIYHIPVISVPIQKKHRSQWIQKEITGIQRDIPKEFGFNTKDLDEGLV